jgi:DNA polymerase-3 subunit epsilon/ATP-dependent DNA helicase DinG
VGPLLEGQVFGPKDTAVLTSATLRVGGNLDYLRERLSLWEAEELALDSPFDYASSTLLYVPTDIPEPDRPSYRETVEEGLVELCRAAGGRTLALFTSHNHLRRTYRAIAPRLAQEDIQVLAQMGGGSRRQLLESFREGERMVLLGTRSFWEGVDVVGEALSCLAIARLPFPVPSEPIFEARSEGFDDPFNDYSVPQAILTFRQGFGRLIRSRRDRGVVVIFDRRVLSKYYGQVFLQSLPRCTFRQGSVGALADEVREWLDGKQAYQPKLKL